MYATTAMRKTRMTNQIKKPMTEFAESVKPMYYKALWHNCHQCRIHFMSEQPHLRAYLCDACWDKMPKYRVNKEALKKQQQAKKGPTYAWLDTDWPLSYILAYIWGCSMCLLIIAYYLFEK